MRLLAVIRLALVIALLHVSASSVQAATKKKSYDSSKLRRLEAPYACFFSRTPQVIRLLGKNIKQLELPSAGKVQGQPIETPAVLRRQKKQLQQSKRTAAARAQKKAITKDLNRVLKLISLSDQCRSMSLIDPTPIPGETSPPTLPQPPAPDGPTPIPTPFVPRAVHAQSNVDFYGATFTTTYYIISHGEERSGEGAQIAIRPQSGTVPYRANIRVYGPDETLHYLEQQERAVGESEITRYSPSAEQQLPQGIFPLGKNGIYEIRVSGNSNVTVEVKLPDNVGWGVSFQNGTYRPFAGQAPTMYTWLVQHPTRPLKLSVLPLLNTNLNMFPGQTLVPTYTNNALSRMDLTVDPSETNTGFVQAVTMPTTTWWEFQAYGMPLILSRTPEEAREIGASIFRSHNAPFENHLLAHPFQDEIATILPEITAHVGSTSNLFSSAGVNFPATKAACNNPQDYDDVLRNIEILNTYAGTLTGAKWSLGSYNGKPNQDISPSSPWIGTLGTSFYGRQLCTTNFDCANGSSCSGGYCQQAFNPNTDRWDRFQPVTYKDPVSSTTWGLYAGKAPRGQLPYSLIWAAVTSNPCNPYGPATPGGPLRYPELLYRGVAGALSDLMMISEDENFYGTNESTTSPYTGVPGFVLENTLPVFDLAAPYLASKMTDPSGTSTLGQRAYKAWKTGVERLVLRHYNDDLASSQNQTAHHLVSFMDFAHGLQEPQEQLFFELMARRFAARFIASMRPAGYFEENTGVCSSYSGIQLNMMGRYLGLTRRSALGSDTAMEDAISRVYDLFNHTGAPEPTGAYISGFNFNHRIGAGFESTQYGGAKMLADYLPEVGVWSRTRNADSSLYRGMLHSLASAFDSMVQTSVPYVLPTVPAHYTDYTPLNNANLKFPAEDTASSIINYGDEYISVRRPGYFTGIYVGKPAAGWSYLRYREPYRLPTTAMALNNGGTSIEDLPPTAEVSVSSYNYTPYTGGGMSLFWTPQYGNAVIGTTWSALAQNGLVAWKNGLRYWADYYSTNFNLDRQNGTLSVSGSIETLPLNYTRSYVFANNQLEVTVTMQATQDLSVEKLIEVIPVPTCTRDSCDNDTHRNRKRLGATLTLPAQPQVANGTIVATNLARVTDQTGKGVEIQFSNVQPLSVHRDGLRSSSYNDELQIGRLEVHLPAQWVQGQTYSFSYALRGVQ